MFRKHIIMNNLSESKNRRINILYSLVVHINGQSGNLRCDLRAKIFNKSVRVVVQELGNCTCQLGCLSTEKVFQLDVQLANLHLDIWLSVDEKSAVLDL